jgi:thiol:disulfide interchange protein
MTVTMDSRPQSRPWTRATTGVALVFAIAVGSGLGTACRRRAAAVPPGCGEEIPPDQLWALHTAAELDARIAAARACGRARGTRVLLEFGATWCPDCVAMTRLERTPVVAQVLRERYERVRINVGRWDTASAALRQRFGINRIAAYVVLDPASGQPVAQRVAEPATGDTQVSPETWAAWLRAPRSVE